MKEADLIRELLERWLGEAGYAVRTAGDEPSCLIRVDAPRPVEAYPRIQALQVAYAGPILVLSGRFRRGLAGSTEAARRLRRQKGASEAVHSQGAVARVNEAPKGTD